MCGTNFSNFSMLNVLIARMVRAELNVVRALRLRRGEHRVRPKLKGGPKPSNLEDLCLVNVSVKYFSKLCFDTIKIQPELKYLKTILEVLTS